jgi:hypothetical protein
MAKRHRRRRKREHGSAGAPSNQIPQHASPSQVAAEAEGAPAPLEPRIAKFPSRRAVPNFGASLTLFSPARDDAEDGVCTSQHPAIFSALTAVLASREPSCAELSILCCIGCCKDLSSAPLTRFADNTFCDTCFAHAAHEAAQSTEPAYAIRPSGPRQA